VESLEGRALLAPFTVGGDPSVHAADFRVTAFASGLNYPTGVIAEPDGSLLVVENTPTSGHTDFYNSTASIVRLVDSNGDGVADGSPTVLADGLPGADSALILAGSYVITTSSAGTITFLHTGAGPGDPLTNSGSIQLAFPSGWWHTTYALAERPAPGNSGDYNVFFNIGSEFNGIKKDANGNILYDSNGVAIPDPTVDSVAASGLLSATLDGDAIYMVTLHDNNGTPVLSGLTKIATGLRNAASIAVDPTTGDLVFADNGIDGTSGGNEAYSTDTLHSIAAADIGSSVPNFGFPYSYTLTNLSPGSPNVVVNPGQRVPPLISFQPLRDPNLPNTGSESEGASGFAIAPTGFPAPLNKGVFIGFHGIFGAGGTSNEENPLLYADGGSGKYFDFISNDEPNIGHIDGATSSADSLFLSDIASNGDVFGTPGDGVIYQIKTRNLPGTNGWQGYALDSQHTAYSPVASTGLGAIRWQAPVDLAPQYSGTDLLIHYGSPLVTAANTVIVPVKTGATGGFEVQALSAATGTAKWTLTSDYALMPSGGANGYSWTPSYSPTLTPSNRLYFPGDGGTVEYTDSPDAPGPAPPATGRLAFFGLSNYNANPRAYNSTVFINTPITSDAAGDIFFGFLVTGSNPLGLTSGVARIGADGTGSYVPVISGVSQVATNSAPALSNDGSLLYVLESTGNFGSGYLVSLDSQSLSVQAQVQLMDPHNTSNKAVIANDGTASPTVGPDGDVYIGVLENPFASNHDRGWLLHFSGDLSTTKTPGAFGWDDTASIVPSSMVSSYTGNSTYLLMTKYNNYAGEGGDGVNKLAILDPNAVEVDPVTGANVMQEVMTIAGPTPDPEFIATHPKAVREWCINTAVVDPGTDSILANSEDGKLYRWNLSTNSFTQQITLTSGVGEAYTPTLIGVDGTVYAINNATLFAVANGSASFVGTDTTTQGSWKGVYGSQGYNIIRNAMSYPSYATVSASGKLDYTWVSSTTDVRALQKADPATDRIAAAWYSGTSFTVDINLTDGAAHKVSIYALDWDHLKRNERIDVEDAVTGSVLDTRTISSFDNGEYLSWNLKAHVRFVFTDLSGGHNAVVSGLFFDSVSSGSSVSSATFLSLDTTTQGSWKGVYGSQGYNIIRNATSYPSYATVTASGKLDYTWVSSTTDVRALQKADPATDRIAAAWYSGTSFTVNINLTDGAAHRVSIYALDWDHLKRNERIDVEDAVTGSVLDTRTISSFDNGEYLSWILKGHVQLVFTDLSGGHNAVVSGLFFDTVSSATFLSSDTTTQGSWKGVYGSQGYNIIRNATSYPSYATVSASGKLDYTWVSSTTDVRALQKADPATDRIAAAWYSGTSFTVDINLTDSAAHKVSIYALDWDHLKRNERIDVVDAVTGSMLDTRTISSFDNGEYLSWNLRGHIRLVFTDLSGGHNAVLSGLFFDPHA
jgi:hypothetical protein